VAPDRPLTVVCLHGLGPAGPSVFDEAASRWRGEFDVRVPTFPGIAGEPAVDRKDYLPSVLARRVEATVDAERFAVVGFSWGGVVGARIAPARLAALVLVDIGYQSHPGEPPTYEELLERHAGVEFTTPAVAAAATAGVDAEPVRDMLPRLADVPILLLVATVPRVDRRAADVAAFRALAPHAEVHTLDGAEHDVLGTTPAAIDLVGAWLRQ